MVLKVYVENCQKFYRGLSSGQQTLHHYLYLLSIFLSWLQRRDNWEHYHNWPWTCHLCNAPINSFWVQYFQYPPNIFLQNKSFISACTILFNTRVQLQLYLSSATFFITFPSFRLFYHFLYITIVPHFFALDSTPI